jgi:broad specificity phosphatase PhoE
MKYFEVRRHSKRERPSRHLSQEGVLLARHVGRRMGAFDRVVASSAWRCVETAVAMGYAVDDARDDLHMSRADDLPADVLDIDSFADFAQAATSAPVKRLAREIVDVWREVADGLPKDGRGLIVGHGVLTELAAVAALAGIDVHNWGKSLAVCEGIRLTFDRGRFVRGEIIRVDKRFKAAGRRT